MTTTSAAKCVGAATIRAVVCPWLKYNVAPDGCRTTFNVAIRELDDGDGAAI